MLLTVGGVVVLVEVGGVANHLPGLLLLLLPGPGLQPGPQAGQLRADALQRGRQVRLVARAGRVCNKIVSPRPESPSSCEVRDSRPGTGATVAVVCSSSAVWD